MCFVQISLPINARLLSAACASTLWYDRIASVSTHWFSDAARKRAQLEASFPLPSEASTTPAPNRQRVSI